MFTFASGNALNAIPIIILITYIFQLMKTKKQVQAYLQAHNFATASDLELVIAFCQQKRILTPKEFPTFTTPGPDKAQTFIEWFEHGFGCGDIAIEDDACCYVLISNNDLNKIEICAYRNESGTWKKKKDSYPASALSTVSHETATNMIIELGRQGWEFDYENLSILKKHIPAINERIEFTKGDHIGLGVVRSVDVKSGEMELYCYFWYDTKEIGHNMHEKNVCDLYSFQHCEQTVVATRRMNRELNKLGKVWNDKLHRIEPVVSKAAKGERYWYINDKMKLVQDKEKDTPTSHFRYIGGNYFLDYDEALEYLNKLNEILRDRLAKPTKIG